MVWEQHLCVTLTMGLAHKLAEMEEMYDERDCSTRFEVFGELSPYLRVIKPMCCLTYVRGQSELQRIQDVH
jgi:hypothetical protein